MPLLESPEYTDADVPDYPQCTPQPLKIIHVGAGASGLIFAHKAERGLKNFELVCYEKNDTIGTLEHVQQPHFCGGDKPVEPR